MNRTVVCLAPAIFVAAVPALAVADEPSDHDLVVRHVGVGWFGVSEIPLAVATTTGNGTTFALVDAPPETVAAPAVGVRYWLNPRIGIDAALGLHYSGGGTTTNNINGTTTKQDIPAKARTGVLLHAGLPVALATGAHLALVVTPEMNFGYASSNFKPAPGTLDAPPDASLSGWRLDVGVRGGIELYFGFIGLPQLALEASVGFSIAHEHTSESARNQSISHSNTQLSTMNVNDPWDIFRTAVAARYYF